MGNPGAFSYAHTLAALMFIKGLGRDSHYFTASSQDTNSRLIASQLLYGVPTSVPIPDLTRTDLLVMMGANPVVSHGSFLTAPRIKDRMHDIVKRGGRVVVSIRAAPRLPRRSNGWASSPTPTPSCCCLCCR